MEYEWCIDACMHAYKFPILNDQKLIKLKIILSNVEIHCIRVCSCKIVVKVQGPEKQPQKASCAVHPDAFYECV